MTVYFTVYKIRREYLVSLTLPSLPNPNPNIRAFSVCSVSQPSKHITHRYRIQIPKYLQVSLFYQKILPCPSAACLPECEISLSPVLNSLALNLTYCYILVQCPVSGSDLTYLFVEVKVKLKVVQQIKTHFILSL